MAVSAGRAAHLQPASEGASGGSAAAPAAALTRVVIIHKDANGSDTDVSVIVAAGSSGGDATLARLSASAVTDARGVSFAGLTLDGVDDGVPVAGGPPVERVPAQAGAYNFKVFRGTAALLSFST